ncbi:unnamed protein product [Lampetra planeri]
MATQSERMSASFAIAVVASVDSTALPSFDSRCSAVFVYRVTVYVTANVSASLPRRMRPSAMPSLRPRSFRVTEISREPRPSRDVARTRTTTMVNALH